MSLLKLHLELFESDMPKNIAKFIVCFLLALSFKTVKFSYSEDINSNFVQLINASSIFCAEDHSGINILKRKDDSLFVLIERKNYLNKIKKRKRNLYSTKKTIKASKIKKKKIKIRKVNIKIRKARKLLKRVRLCFKGNLTKTPQYVSDTEDYGFASACEAIGDSISPHNVPFTISSFQRIINGTDCNIGDSPIIKLTTYFREGDPSSCTGVVVSPTKIITAAHCVNGIVREVRVRTGYGTFTTENVLVHPSYRRNSDFREKFDIAIITMNETVSTRTIDILSDNDLRIGELGIIAGYGSDERFNSGQLRAGEMTLDYIYGGGIAGMFFGDNSNTCKGDSGGPFLVSRNGKLKLAAITSSGTQTNCNTGDFAIFSSLMISENQNFLDDNL